MAWKGFFGWQAHQADPSHGPAAPAAERHTEPRQLLQLHRQRLATLRLESGYPAETFENLFGALAYAVAEYVHVLPATRAENHAERGGLLRLAIEAACGAYRRADGQFLSGVLSTDVRNRERDRVWRYATFVGALLRPLGRALTDVRVSRTDSGPEGRWDAYQEPLWGWMRRVDVTQLAIEWQRNDAAPTQAASIWLAARLLTPAALNYLHTADGLSQTLLQLFSGQAVGRIAELIEQAYQGVIDEDLARLGQRNDLNVAGIQIEHRLLDALRSLVREKWTLNSAGGRLWVTDQGVFLSWKAAVNDLAVRLRADGVSNAPRDPDTLAELLTQHGVLTPNPQALNGLKHYYRITPQLRGAPKQTIEAVKIADTELIGLRLEGVDAIEAYAPDHTEKGGSTARAPRKTDPHSMELPWGTQLPAGAPAQKSQPRTSPPAATSTGSSAPPAPPTRQAAAAVPAAQSASSSNEPLNVGQSNPTTATPLATTAPNAAVGASSTNEKKRALEFDLKRLNRFGAAGQVLKALAERLLSEPHFTQLIALEEGVVLAYPQAIEPFCPQPQRFLSDCEAQGLLVDTGGGRRMVRTRAAGEDHLPEQYVVLSPRVAKCLPGGNELRS